MHRFLSILLGAVLTLGGGHVDAQGSAPRVLVMGDSLFAWNRFWNGSVADSIGLQSDARVVDRSAVASFVLTGGLERQFTKGDWDWVIMTGGGNDLWLGCGCSACEASLTKMVSPDGRTGRIPDLISHVLSTGAKVAYVGYLRSPELVTPIEHCKDEGDELERRVRIFAETSPEIHFISLEDLVPPRGQGYFAFDLIHPSRTTSFLIGSRIADVILSNR